MHLSELFNQLADLCQITFIRFVRCKVCTFPRPLAAKASVSALHHDMAANFLVVHHQWKLQLFVTSTESTRDGRSVVYFLSKSTVPNHLTEFYPTRWTFWSGGIGGTPPVRCNAMQASQTKATGALATANRVLHKFITYPTLELI